jgi:hypothetical protein
VAVSVAALLIILVVVVVVVALVMINPSNCYSQFLLQFPLFILCISNTDVVAVPVAAPVAAPAATGSILY